MGKYEYTDETQELFRQAVELAKRAGVNPNDMKQVKKNGKWTLEVEECANDAFRRALKQAKRAFIAKTRQKDHAKDTPEEIDKE